MRECRREVGPGFGGAGLGVSGLVGHLGVGQLGWKEGEGGLALVECSVMALVDWSLWAAFGLIV